MQCNTISLDKIVQLENSRGKHEEKDLATLMSSIKKDGLLQPIGVRETSKGKYEIVFGNRRFEAFKKLGRSSIPAVVVDVKDKKDFLIINLIENAQRSDITVYEQGRIFHHLYKKEDMSYSEIAVRVGLPTGRVKASTAIFQDTPKEFRDKIVYGKGGGRVANRKGTIPIALAERVVLGCKTLNLSTKEKSKILKACANDKLSKDHVTEMFNLIKEGNKVEKVLNKLDKVKNIKITIPVYQRDIQKWNENWEGDLFQEIREIIYSNKDLDFKRPF